VIGEKAHSLHHTIVLRTHLFRSSLKYEFSEPLRKEETFDAQPIHVLHKGPHALFGAALQSLKVAVNIPDSEVVLSRF
jgi:hypothetical protein